MGGAVRCGLGPTGVMEPSFRVKVWPERTGGGHEAFTTYNVRRIHDEQIKVIQEYEDSHAIKSDTHKGKCHDQSEEPWNHDLPC